MRDTSVTDGPGQQPAGQPRTGQPDPGQPGAGHARRQRRRRARKPPALAWKAGTAIAAVALFTCYLRQSATAAVGSDGASQALQAWDLLHGNPLLHGWWLTDVSFYTTELPQYALIEAAHGLNADVIHLAGAMTYTLLVLTAAVLARGRAAGREGLLRAALAAGIMLAPPLGPGTQTLVLSPDHTGTGVPVLLIFLFIDRTPFNEGKGARWYVQVLVCLALAWTAVADAMTIFVAILPLALACASRALATPSMRSETPPPNGQAPPPNGQAPPPIGQAPPPNGQGPPPAVYSPPPSGVSAARRHEAALAVAAVLAVPVELAATALIKAAGGWQVNGLRTALATTGQLAGNLRLTGEGLLELFGANVFDAATGPQTALAAVHLAGVALSLAAVLLAARRFFRAPLIESVLLAGIVIDLAAYLSGGQAVDILSTREIAPVLPFGAVLAGRLLGPKLLAVCQIAQPSAVARATPQTRAASQARARAARYALCAVLALYLAGLGYAAAQPPATAQDASLASWLRARHLTAGLSGYHQANIVTLDSGGTVTLRPVRAVAGRLAAYAWNANSEWFDPSPAGPTFLVLTRPGAPGEAGLTVRDAVVTFGPPASTDDDGAFLILVWPHGNLLTALR